MNSAFERMYDVTALGRPFDPRDVTNLIILILTPVIGGIAGGFMLASGYSLGLAARVGASAAIVTILTWIIARETDIDHPWSAFLSVVLALIGFYLIQRNLLGGEEPRLLDTAVLSLFLATMAMRLVSRIVGPPAQLADSVMVLLLIVAVAFLGTWVVAIAGVLALLLDGILSKPNRRNLIFAALGVVVIAARIIILEVGEPGNLTLPYLAVIAVITVLYGATILATRELRMRCDVQGYELDVRRVRASMLLGLVVALIASIWDGNAGVLKTLPLWAALLGSAVYSLPLTILQFRSAGKTQAPPPKSESTRAQAQQQEEEELEPSPD